MLPPPMPEQEGSRRWARPSLAELRRSLLPVPLFNPRWKPWSPARVVSVALGFAAVMALVVAVFRPSRPSLRWVAAFTAPSRVAAAAADDDAPVVSPAVVAPPHADAALARDRRSPIAGGLLTVLPGFKSLDGAYDLVIHFHGNTDLVEESYATSGLNAVLVVLNLGTGSGVYEDRFANALILPDILDRVQTTLDKRGLAHPRLRRLALTAWSAGYGAVLQTLSQPALADKVDAVILLDGIHVGYKPKSTEMYLERLAPFEQFAREAVAGRKLFSITHSNITPMGHYAGTHETTNALLRALDVPRRPGGDAPARPNLHSIDGVIARKKLVALIPETVATQGGLRVRGYSGDQPEDHIAHLVHFSVTALPDLVERWRDVPAPR